MGSPEIPAAAAKKAPLGRKGFRVSRLRQKRNRLKAHLGWARCVHQQSGIKAKGMKDEEGFDEFWKVYPRKVAKGDARKAWKQMATIRPPLEKLIRAVIVARATEDWRKDGGKFVPYPATWLRAERWEDVHEVEIDRVRAGYLKLAI